MSVIITILRSQSGTLSLLVRLLRHLMLHKVAGSGGYSTLLEAFDWAPAIVGWVLQGCLAASCFPFLIELIELEEVCGERQQ